MSLEYVCQHGLRSPLPFVHEVASMTSAGVNPPASACYPTMLDATHRLTQTVIPHENGNPA